MNKNCEICNKEYYIKLSHAHLRRTCSHKCGGVLKSKEHSGENHPFFGKHHTAETWAKIRSAPKPPQNNPNSLKNLKLGHLAMIGKEPWNRGLIMWPEHKRNEEHPNFIHGVMKTGYRRINIGEKKRVLEHRHIAEKTLGRLLLTTEHVHHIDGNKLNNDPLNLLVLSASEHRKLHNLQKQYA